MHRAQGHNAQIKQMGSWLRGFEELIEWYPTPFLCIWHFEASSIDEMFCSSNYKYEYMTLAPTYTISKNHNTFN